MWLLAVVHVVGEPIACVRVAWQAGGGAAQDSAADGGAAAPGGVAAAHARRAPHRRPTRRRRMVQDAWTHGAVNLTSQHSPPPCTLAHCHCCSLPTAPHPIPSLAASLEEHALHAILWALTLPTTTTTLPPPHPTHPRVLEPAMARAAVVVGNVVRRVMHAIREEDASLHLAHAHAHAHAQGQGHSHAGHAAPDVAVRGGGGAVGGERWGEEGEGEGRGGGGALSAASVAGSNRSVLLAPSLHNLLDPALLPATPPSSSAPLPPSARSSDGASAPSPAAAATAAAAERKLKHVVIERINDLLEEIDNHQSQLADQALEHIHQNEVILTMGFSDTLLLFLLEARKRRSFHVVVAEGAPCYGGHKLAAALAARGVAVTVIADAGVFALMARVNLVLLAAHAVMANGGVLAPIGLDMVALAARRHAVPFVVLAGIFTSSSGSSRSCPCVRRAPHLPWPHQVCPLYPQQAGLAGLNDLRSPAGVVGLAELAHWEGLAHLGAALTAQGRGSGKAGAQGGEEAEGQRGEAGGEAGVEVEVEVVNPAFDYIPPELVTLLVTDTSVAPLHAVSLPCMPSRFPACRLASLHAVSLPCMPSRFPACRLTPLHAISLPCMPSHSPACHLASLHAVSLPCMPSRFPACRLTPLHAISLPCMPSHSPACHLTSLHAVTLPCMPSHFPACRLTPLHAISLPCMPSHSPACHLASLHAVSLPCMPSRFPACRLTPLHAISLPCMPSHSPACHLAPLHAVSLPCMPSRFPACRLTPLHAISLPCMPSHSPACHLASLHAVSLPCMPSHFPACRLTPLHAILLPCMPSHSPACHLASLHAVSLPCMPSRFPACRLTPLHAVSLPCMPSHSPACRLTPLHAVSLPCMVPHLLPHALFSHMCAWQGRAQPVVHLPPGGGVLQPARPQPLAIASHH
ncbi:unnamed protein product [Closterium sp. Naga37s-1]|nr:unnamed protein product [Closterium sp. Naga37s-1]